MKKQWFLVLCIIIGGMSLTISPTVSAQQQQQNQELSKAEAAERARAEVKGRVLKVEKRQNSYRVKVLQKSGRVVTVDVDKRSGRVKQTNDK